MEGEAENENMTRATLQMKRVQLNVDYTEIKGSFYFPDLMQQSPSGLGPSATGPLSCSEEWRRSGGGTSCTCERTEERYCELALLMTKVLKQDDAILGVVTLNSHCPGQDGDDYHGNSQQQQRSRCSHHRDLIWKEKEKSQGPSLFQQKTQ